MSDAFSRAYARLNTQQQRAVDTLEGPVMVIAGPGTGKTQVLAMRIGQLLQKTDALPRTILALTFTDAAATTMRQRLATLIGPAAYGVQIATFHAFCGQVIAEHPESFVFERDSRPLTELERHELLGEILSETSLEELRPLNRPLFYLKDCVRVISQLKREYISPEKLSKLVAEERALLEQGETKATPAQRRVLEKRIAKQQELVQVYARYQERLYAAHRVDFDDLIGSVATVFRQDALLLQEYQEQIQYVLVDEYQDTNSAQNEVVSQLGSYWGEQANVFVVGDPHQSIFRFQGASLENMLGFLVRYPAAEVVTLTDGYRCGQTMYAAAHALVRGQKLPTVRLAERTTLQLETALSAQLKSQTKNIGQVLVAKLPTQTAEQLYITQQVQQLHAQGTSLADIAVLYRTNADGVALEQVFSSLGIRYQIERGTNALDVPFVQQLLSLCSLLFHLRAAQDTEAFAVMCFDWVRVNRLAVFKLTRQAAQSGRSLVTLAELSWDAFAAQQTTVDVAEQLTQAEHESVHTLVQQWVSWVTLEPSMPFHQWFSVVLQQTNCIEWILAQLESQTLLQALQGVYAYIQDTVAANHQFSLADFIRTCTIMQEQGIAVRQADIRTSAQAVTLSTAHSAKGKEWQHVFVYHCVDAQWGGSRSVDKLPLPEHLLQFTEPVEKAAAAEADDRRLLYVALTRARESVTITYPEFVVEQARQKAQLPSRFLSQIEECVEQLPETTVEQFGQAAEYHIPQLLLPDPVVSSAEADDRQREFFQYLVANFSLSVSALNHYLEDPLKFRDQDLLRVPSSKDAYLSYGSAMHRALEFWQRPRLLGKDTAPLTAVLQEFDKALAREVLTAEEFGRRQKKGRQVLSAFVAHMADQKEQVLSIERQFGSLRSPVFLGDIPLKGRIDRLDWVDQQAKQVRVVDYKTGKPKTAGEIFATTASAELSERERALPETIRGPLMRQLVFYKLLAELDPSFSGTVTHGRFLFVEPNNSVRTPFVVRDFEITERAVEDLKELIVEVMEEIRALTFFQG